MTPLRQRFIEDLQLRNCSPLTIKAYVHHVHELARYFNQSPEQLSDDQLHCYLLYLLHEKQVAWSSYNTHRVALKNNRLVKLQDDRVTFTWKDYADGCRHKEMTLDAVEFVRRFALHIMPKGLVRIRHYGRIFPFYHHPLWLGLLPQSPYQGIPAMGPVLAPVTIGSTPAILILACSPLANSIAIATASLPAA